MPEDIDRNVFSQMIIWCHQHRDILHLPGTIHAVSEMVSATSIESELKKNRTMTIGSKGKTIIKEGRRYICRECCKLGMGLQNQALDEITVNAALDERKARLLELLPEELRTEVKERSRY